MTTMLTEELSRIVGNAFAACGHDASFGKTALSNRPDLGQFQCNGAMSAARQCGAVPFEVAEKVAARLLEQPEAQGVFSAVSVVKPGFVNLSLTGEYLAACLEAMRRHGRHGVDEAVKPQTVVLDYGGPNVAKPLHVGHLRSAVIGESVKRVARFLGHKVIADAHLGDWGLQIGLVLMETKRRKPNLSYFAETFMGEYPTEAPFTLEELEDIYPAASARAKEDETFREEARKATLDLQSGRRGYRALWQHIMAVSVADLRKNYARLGVSFDLWEGESNAQELIAPMLAALEARGLARESEGALVVDIALEGDAKELPPCIVRKSDGGALYQTTDIATIVDRMQRFEPDRIMYVVDKRQELHFTQVFRTARKAGFVREETDLVFLGFGTMNGRDGKPFKTREGGVIRLETLLDMVADAARPRLEGRDDIDAASVAESVALAAIKFGDLSNQPSKDYVFDIERFTAFEGKTGPYIQYSMVRIKSIIRKVTQRYGNVPEAVHIAPPASAGETGLVLKLCGFNEIVHSVYAQNSPQWLCQFAYEVCELFNRFYNERNILNEPDAERRRADVALLLQTLAVLETCANLLGFTAPERM